MSIKNIINQCIERNIKLSSHDENLKIDAPKGAMTQQLLNLIKANKQEILEFLQQHQTQKVRVEIPRVYPQVDQGPLSAGQKQMWLLDKALENNDNYQFYRILNIQGEVDVNKVEQALGQIIDRHSILRTRYIETAEQMVQKIDSEADFSLQYVDLASIEQGQKERMLAANVNGFKQHRFNLAAELMLKGLLIKTGPKAYQLHIKMHHIATDGWSIGIIVNELTSLYQALEQGRLLPANDNYQYIDLALWQQTEAALSKRDNQLGFFERYLADAPHKHQLPVDPAQRKDLADAEHLFTQLPASLVTQLKAFCQQHQVTLFSYLQFSLAILISRYSHYQDIVMGTPMANRPSQQLAQVVGYFVNTLPLRTQIDSQQSFLSALKAQHISSLEVMDKQSLAFEQIVRQCDHPRLAGVSPLVQLMFVMQNNDIPELRLGDAKIAVETPLPSSIDMDLVVECSEQDQQLNIRWSYARGLFEPQLINAMAEHFSALLEAGLNQAQAPIHQLSMMSEQQVSSLLEQAQQPSLGLSEHQCIQQLFEQQAARAPDQLAVVFEQQQLSYQQLNQKANQLAHYLRQQHQVGPQSLVGLCLSRSVETLIAILAVLKAGGAYVPLDPNDPKARVQFILQDAGIELLLTQAEPLQALSEFKGQALVIDGLAEGYPHTDIDIETSGVTAQSLAYVIYTSGSTGQPKGVLTEHRNLLNFGLGFEQQLQLCQRSVDAGWLWLSSYVFDASLKGLYLLANGVKLIIPTSEQARTPADIVELIERHQLGVINATPQLLALIVKEPMLPKVDLISSGEAIGSSNFKLFKQFALRSQTRFINAYGPTETTVNSCFADLTRGNKEVIGRAVANTSCLVLDQDLQLVPPGGIGELFIAGSGLARGYLNRPELSQQVFIDNPYYQPQNPCSSPRLYRSGDLVRLTFEAELEFVGRVDQQVKIRGFRIELGEIEACLQADPRLDSALVLTHHIADTEQLVAYVKASPAGAELAADGLIKALTEHLQRHLPSSMVPNHLIKIEQWPLTVNGKIDRQALPLPHGELTQGVVVAAQTENEQLLVAMFAKLLQLNPESISTSMSFFELGGHSLLAINAKTELNQRGYELKIAELLQPVSLKVLAEKLQLSQGEGFEPPAKLIDTEQTPLAIEQLNLIDLTDDDLHSLVSQVPGGSANIDDIYALSPLQEGMLFHHITATDEDIYLSTFALKLDNEQIVQRLVAGLERLIERHDTLRTQFYWQGLSEPAQVVLKQAKLKVEDIQLAPYTSTAEALEQLEQQRQLVMPLNQGPLLQLKLGRCPQTEQVFVLVEHHHLIIDHIGLDILVAELIELMTQQQPSLAAVTPYRNLVAYAKAQNQQTAGIDYFEAKFEQLTDASALFNHKQSEPLMEFKQSLSGSVSQTIRALSKQSGASIAAILHTAWALVASRCANQDDVVFGTVMSGRLNDYASSQRTMGLAINTLPLRVKLAQLSVAEVLEQLNSQLKDLIKVEQTPLAQVLKLLPGGEQWFNSVLNYRHSANLLGPDQLIEGVEIIAAQERTNYAIAIDIDDYGSEDNFALTVQTTNGISAQSLSEYYIAGLEQILAALEHNPEQPLFQLEMISAAGIEQLLYDLNHTGMEYPQHQTIDQCFAQQAAKTPNHIALVFGQRQLSYAELAQRVDQLAAYLLTEHQLQTDQLVGLCVERSIETIVAILAILKAGGAYVPLVPSLPQQRLEQLVDHCDIQLLLTDDSSKDVTSGLNCTVLSLDDLQLGHFENSQQLFETVNKSSRDLAYVIFTSGSTGMPKGVMIEHQACVNHCFGMIKQLALSADSRIAQTAPLSFDISVWQMLTSLLIGGQTVIIPDQLVKSPIELLAHVEQQQISLLQIVPSLMSVLLDECEQQQHQFNSLKCLSVTGEACPAKLQQRWEQVYPDIPLLNAYGPAECGDDVLLYANRPISHQRFDTFSRIESQVRGYCRDYPALFKKALGSEMFDSSDQRYLDLFCGAGALNYGHNNPRLKAALRDYIDSDGITHSLDLFTQAKANFLETFDRHILAPRELEYKVMCCGPTGTNAVEAALKLARKVTGRKWIAYGKKSYHGMTIGALSVTGYQAKAGVPLSYTKEIDFVAEDDQQLSVDVFKQQLESFEQLPAAIILEIVQAEGGLNVANKQWLQQLFAYAKQHNILVIVDDIQAGCGRTGRFFSFEHFEVKPDLVCLSKSIGGYGLPMALLLIRPDLDIWTPAEHNGTFRGNNHAFVTGAKAIELYWKDSAFEQQLSDKSQRLANGLEQLIAKYPQLQGKRKGLGLIQGIAFGDDDFATAVKHQAYSQKLVIETAGKRDEVLKFLPALTMTEAQIDEGLQLVDMAIAQVLAGRSPTLAQATMPVGKPIGNLRVYVVNEQLQLVPFGAVGELLVAGDGLARGYYNEPQMTAERFFNWRCGELTERVYQTGDLVRYLADGELEFIARVDHQVKIRGFRIELGEIEAQLAAHPQVDSGVVVATTMAGSEQLVGYVKPTSVIKAAIQTQWLKALNDHLSGQLPEYMIPAAMVIVDHWPLTANGKLDRKLLPQPKLSALQPQYLAPTSATEKVLLEVWAQLLGLAPQMISANANFFELGGHSLLVIKLVGQLQKLGWSPAAAAIFEQGKLSDMAAYLDNLSSKQPYQVPENLIDEGVTQLTPSMLPLVQLSQSQIDHLVAQVPGGVANIQDIYPLAPLQQGLLYIHQLSDKRDPYVATLGIECGDQARLNDFIAAVEVLIARHDVLRTAVLWQELEQPVQVVLRQVKLAVDYLSPSQLRGDREAVAEYVKDGDFYLQLQQAPLLGLEVVKATAGDGYLVVFKAHHLISDHISLEIFTNELMAILNHQPLSETASAPFRDFIAHTIHQQKQLDVKGFFSEQLAEVENPTVVFDLDDMAMSQGQKQATNVALTAELSEQIRHLSHSHQCSAAALFHLAWGQVLAAFSGQQTVVFGTVLTGRMSDLKGIERMMGMTINTLPCVVSLAHGSASQLLTEVNNQLKALLSYEQVPLAQAQSYSSVEGNGALFNASINYRHSAKAQQPNEVDGQTRLAEQVNLFAAVERNNYPLTMAVNDFGQAHPFTLDFGISTEVDSNRLIEAFQLALASLLQMLECDSSEALSSVNVLPPQETQTLLQQFNQTQTDYPQQLCVHQLFEQQVAKTPQHRAVVYQGQSISYQQLDHKANQLAHYLRQQHSVQPDSLIGIYLQRSMDTVIAMLAVLKAGAAYVPLDVNYPLERLQYMLDDAQLSVVLSHTELSAGLSDFAGSVIPLDGLASTEQHLFSDYADVNLEGESLGLTADNLAYVIYTSGSTGQPKGVMIEHRNVVAYLSGNQDNYFDPQLDGSLVFTSLSFDLSLPSIFLPLFNGQFVELAPEHPLLADSVAPTLLTASPRLLRMTPSHVQLLLAQVGDQTATAAHVFVVGGEALEPNVAKQLKAVFVNSRLYNHYGPSEATIGCTSHLVDAAELELSQAIAIGKPMANAAVVVLSAQQQLVAFGGIGELYIGGHTVARGYWNRPQLTKARFIVNPFAEQMDPAHGEVLYRTGDLVRYRADGQLEFIGRGDDQVKIRGHRIELGEIEAQLSQEQQVDSAVVLVKSLAGSDQLIGYIKTVSVLGSSEQQQLNRDIIASLRAKMPEYMVPTLLIAVAQWPLTPNGKVARHRLPTPDATIVQDQYQAPQTEAEQVLVATWSELLEIPAENISVTANFFELGGHSLLILNLISKLAEQGYHLNVVDIYQAPSLAQLALQLDNSKGAANDYVVPENLLVPGTQEITPEMLPLIELTQSEIDQVVAKVPGGIANIEDIYPLAPLQQGMVFIHQMTKQKDPYVSNMVIEAQNGQAFAQLVAGLRYVINRHDVLRTAVLWNDFTNPVQVVLKQVELPVEYLALDGEDIGQSFERYVTENDHYLDLEQAPLIALKVAVDKHSGRHYVLINRHHLITDHISGEILMSELKAYYQGEQQQLAPASLYRTFVARTLNNLAELDPKAFFAPYLADFETPTLPFNEFADLEQEPKVELLTLVPGMEVSGRIRAAMKLKHSSPAAFFHGVWAMVLAKLSAQDDVVFGTVLSGRMGGGAGIENAMGMMINTLPVRVNLAEQNAEQLLHEINEYLWALIPYEQVSLAQVQKYSGVSLNLPLFNGCINYRHTPIAADADVSGLAVDANIGEGLKLLLGTEQTNYPLMLSINDFGQSHSFSYDLHIYDHIHAERIGEYFEQAVEQLLQALEQNHNQQVAKLDIMPAAEKHLLLTQLNQTQVDYPSDTCIHHAFEAQALATPHNVALRIENQQLSYQQLNQQANQLAHYLVNHQQLKSGDFIGVCMERSMEMIVTLMAVFKVGGVYVPMVPSLPASRLQHLAEQSQMALIIADSPSEKLSTLVTPLVALDQAQFRSQLAQQPESNLTVEQVKVNANDLAYVIYTSGSTGTPKGVMIEHKACINHCYAMIEQLELLPGDSIAQTAPLSFDISVWQMLTMLLVGGQTVIIKDQIVRSPQLLIDEVDGKHISLLQIVPSLLSVVLDHCEQSPGHFSQLKCLSVTGEACSVKLQQRWQQQFADIALINAYGPAECADDVLLYNNLQTNPSEGLSALAFTRNNAKHSTMPVGKPIGNLRVYVVDQHDLLVPFGVVGELLVAGDGLARGYINQTEMSASKFVQWQQGELSEKVYRSGDLVRLLADGNIEFVGRADDQVKVRGFRIEPGEVEAQLACIEQVDSALVMAKPLGGSAQLVAYVKPTVEIATEQSGDLIKAILEALRLQLPEHMVPSIVMLVVDWPLTANGKVDRKALPQPDGSALQGEYIEPQTESEKTLVEIWSRLLEIEASCISANAKFFELGGHSLLTMRLSAEIRTEFDILIDVSTVFSVNTLSELASVIDSMLALKQPQAPVLSEGVL